MSLARLRRRKNSVLNRSAGSVVGVDVAAMGGGRDCIGVGSQDGRDGVEALVVAVFAFDSTVDCAHNHLYTAIVGRDNLFFKFGRLTIVRQ